MKKYKGTLESPYFLVELRMKKQQVWFQTNLGYNATKDQLLRSKMFSGDDWKGRLTVSLKEFKDVTFQITTHGKLGIIYPEETDYQDFLERIKPFLVRADGTPAEIVDTIKESSQKKKKSEERKFGLFEWGEHRAERKRLERWESRLAVLQALRPYLRHRFESDGVRFFGLMLDEVNEEIDMLRKRIASGKE